MTSLYPLSPLLAAIPATTSEMQRSLYQLATLPSFEAVRPVLESIQTAVRPVQEELLRRGARPLARFDSLLDAHSVNTAQALTEIADSKRGTEILTALTASPLLRETVGSAAKSLTIDTGRIQSGIQSWYASMTPEMDNREPFSLARLWGQVNYWAGMPVAAGGIGYSLVQAGLEAANLISTGTVHPGQLAAAGVALGSGLYLGWQRRNASNVLTGHAKDNTIEHEHVAEFFRRYRGPFPFETVNVARLSPNRDILDDIRRSAGHGGPNTISQRHTARLMHDFVTLGKVAARSFVKDPTEVLYDRLAQAIGMGCLEKLGWQPIVLNPERMADLRERQRSGRKLIFVGNHRSHLDILSIVSLLRDFRVRFPAKDELFKIPVLKDLLIGGHHPRINRGNRQGRYKALLKQGIPLLEKGLSLYVFAEGTRTPTSDRSEEVGMLPFELGAFGLALQFDKDVDVVPVASYGLGRTLPGDDKQALREGTMINAPVVISIGEPIEIEQYQKGPRGNLDPKQALGNATWAKIWAELAAIQATMNNGPRI